MLRLLPDVRTVMVVIGASGLERFWLQEVQRQFRPFENRVTFVWTNAMSTDELIRRSASLPPRSAILYGIWSLDAKSVPQMEAQTLDALHAAANAPMFGLHAHQLGHGIVGGPLLSLDNLSHESAAVALRLLRGEAASAIPPRTLVSATTTYDGRELRRWRIAERRLEPGGAILFRDAASERTGASLLVAAVSAAGAMVVLMIALVRTASKRRSEVPLTPADLNAAEAALSKLSQRLMRAQEDERASTARAIHDDVAQQLAALTLSLHALGGTTDRGDADLRARIEDLCAAFWTLERDILAISDPVYHRVTLLGLAAAARSYCARRCAEAGVTLEFSADGVPDGVPDAISIALFRVMEEAVGNALTYARSPRLDVTFAGHGQAIDLDVEDTGTGFDANAALRRGALGLIGMRERMRLVGGTCAIASRPGNGTRVHARVPYSS